MLTRITPSGIARPAANYSHATLVPPGARWLYLSGQVGITRDGTIPDDVATQAEICFENILAILAEADMAPADLVRLTTYLIDAADRDRYMAVRDRHVGTPPPDRRSSWSPPWPTRATGSRSRRSPPRSERSLVASSPRRRHTGAIRRASCGWPALPSGSCCWAGQRSQPRAMP
jgi:enamine deaminase RidA (YjgF/YER057c/UK114 family)